MDFILFKLLGFENLVVIPSKADNRVGLATSRKYYCDVLLSKNGNE